MLNSIIFVFLSLILISFIQNINAQEVFDLNSYTNCGNINTFSTSIIQIGGFDCNESYFNFQQSSSIGIAPNTRLQLDSPDRYKLDLTVYFSFDNGLTGTWYSTTQKQGLNTLTITVPDILTTAFQTPEPIPNNIPSYDIENIYRKDIIMYIIKDTSYFTISTKLYYPDERIFNYFWSPLTYPRPISCPLSVPPTLVSTDTFGCTTCLDTIDTTTIGLDCGLIVSIPRVELLPNWEIRLDGSITELITSDWTIYLQEYIQDRSNGREVTQITYQIADSTNPSSRWIVNMTPNASLDNEVINSNQFHIVFKHKPSKLFYPFAQTTVVTTQNSISFSNLNYKPSDINRYSPFTYNINLSISEKWDNGPKWYDYKDNKGFEGWGYNLGSLKMTTSSILFGGRTGKLIHCDSTFTKPGSQDTLHTSWFNSNLMIKMVGIPVSASTPTTGWDWTNTFAFNNNKVNQPDNRSDIPDIQYATSPGPTDNNSYIGFQIFLIFPEPQTPGGSGIEQFGGKFNWDRLTVNCGPNIRLIKTPDSIITIDDNTQIDMNWNPAHTSDTMYISNHSHKFNFIPNLPLLPQFGYLSSSFDINKGITITTKFIPPNEYMDEWIILDPLLISDLPQRFWLDPIGTDNNFDKDTSSSGHIIQWFIDQGLIDTGIPCKNSQDKIVGFYSPQVSPINSPLIPPIINPSIGLKLPSVIPGMIQSTEECTYSFTVSPKWIYTTLFDQHTLFTSIDIDQTTIPQRLLRNQGSIYGVNSTPLDFTQIVKMDPFYPGNPGEFEFIYIAGITTPIIELENNSSGEATSPTASVKPFSTLGPYASPVDGDLYQRYQANIYLPPIDSGGNDNIDNIMMCINGQSISGGYGDNLFKNLINFDISTLNNDNGSGLCMPNNISGYQQGSSSIKMSMVTYSGGQKCIKFAASNNDPTFTRIWTCRFPIPRIDTSNNDWYIPVISFHTYDSTIFPLNPSSITSFQFRNNNVLPHYVLNIADHWTLLPDRILPYSLTTFHQITTIESQSENVNLRITPFTSSIRHLIESTSLSFQKEAPAITSEQIITCPTNLSLFQNCIQTRFSFTATAPIQSPILNLINTRPNDSPTNNLIIDKIKIQFYSSDTFIESTKINFPSPIPTNGPNIEGTALPHWITHDNTSNLFTLPGTSPYVSRKSYFLNWSRHIPMYNTNIDPYTQLLPRGTYNIEITIPLVNQEGGFPTIDKVTSLLYHISPLTMLKTSRQHIQHIRRTIIPTLPALTADFGINPDIHNIIRWDLPQIFRHRHFSTIDYTLNTNKLIDIDQYNGLGAYKRPINNLNLNQNWDKKMIPGDLLDSIQQFGRELCIDAYGPSDDSTCFVSFENRETSMFSRSGGFHSFWSSDVLDHIIDTQQTDGTRGTVTMNSKSNDSEYLDTSGVGFTVANKWPYRGKIPFFSVKFTFLVARPQNPLQNLPLYQSFVTKMTTYLQSIIAYELPTPDMTVALGSQPWLKCSESHITFLPPVCGHPCSPLDCSLVYNQLSLGASIHASPPQVRQDGTTITAQYQTGDIVKWSRGTGGWDNWPNGWDTDSEYINAEYRSYNGWDGVGVPIFTGFGSKSDQNIQPQISLRQGTGRLSRQTLYNARIQLPLLVSIPHFTLRMIKYHPRRVLNTMQQQLPVDDFTGVLDKITQNFNTQSFFQNPSQPTDYYYLCHNYNLLNGLSQDDVDSKIIRSDWCPLQDPDIRCFNGQYVTSSLYPHLSTCSSNGLNTYGPDSKRSSSFNGIMTGFQSPDGYSQTNFTPNQLHFSIWRQKYILLSLPITIPTLESWPIWYPVQQSIIHVEPFPSVWSEDVMLIKPNFIDESGQTSLYFSRDNIKRIIGGNLDTEPCLLDEDGNDSDIHCIKSPTFQFDLINSDQFTPETTSPFVQLELNRWNYMRPWVRRISTTDAKLFTKYQGVEVFFRTFDNKFIPIRVIRNVDTENIYYWRFTVKIDIGLSEFNFSNTLIYFRDLLSSNLFDPISSDQKNIEFTALKQIFPQITLSQFTADYTACNNGNDKLQEYLDLYITPVSFTVSCPNNIQNLIDYPVHEDGQNDFSPGQIKMKINENLIDFRLKYCNGTPDNLSLSTIYTLQSEISSLLLIPTIQNGGIDMMNSPTVTDFRGFHNFIIPHSVHFDTEYDSTEGITINILIFTYSILPITLSNTNTMTETIFSNTILNRNVLDQFIGLNSSLPLSFLSYKLVKLSTITTLPNQPGQNQITIDLSMDSVLQQPNYNGIIYITPIDPGTQYIPLVTGIKTSIQPIWVETEIDLPGFQAHSGFTDSLLLTPFTTIPTSSWPDQTVEFSTEINLEFQYFYREQIQSWFNIQLEYETPGLGSFYLTKNNKILKYWKIIINRTVRSCPACNAYPTQYSGNCITGLNSNTHCLDRYEICSPGFNRLSGSCTKTTVGLNTPDLTPSSLVADPYISEDSKPYFVLRGGISGYGPSLVIKLIQDGISEYPLVYNPNIIPLNPTIEFVYSCLSCENMIKIGNYQLIVQDHQISSFWYRLTLNQELTPQINVKSNIIPSPCLSPPLPIDYCETSEYLTAYCLDEISNGSWCKCTSIASGTTCSTCINDINFHSFGSTCAYQLDQSSPTGTGSVLPVIYSGETPSLPSQWITPNYQWKFSFKYKPWAFSQKTAFGCQIRVEYINPDDSSIQSLLSTEYKDCSPQTSIQPTRLVTISHAELETKILQLALTHGTEILITLTDGGDSSRKITFTSLIATDSCQYYQDTATEHCSPFGDSMCPWETEECNCSIEYFGQNCQYKLKIFDFDAQSLGDLTLISASNPLYVEQRLLFEVLPADPSGTAPSIGLSTPVTVTTTSGDEDISATLISPGQYSITIPSGITSSTQQISFTITFILNGVDVIATPIFSFLNDSCGTVPECSTPGTKSCRPNQLIITDKTARTIPLCHCYDMYMGYICSINPKIINSIGINSANPLIWYDISTPITLELINNTEEFDIFNWFLEINDKVSLIKADNQVNQWDLDLGLEEIQFDLKPIPYLFNYITTTTPIPLDFTFKITDLLDFRPLWMVTTATISDVLTRKGTNCDIIHNFYSLITDKSCLKNDETTIHTTSCSVKHWSIDITDDFPTQEPTCSCNSPFFGQICALEFKPPHIGLYVGQVNIINVIPNRDTFPIQWDMITGFSIRLVLKTDINKFYQVDITDQDTVSIPNDLIPGIYNWELTTIYRGYTSTIVYNQDVDIVSRCDQFLIDPELTPYQCHLTQTLQCNPQYSLSTPNFTPCECKPGFFGDKCQLNIFFDKMNQDFKILNLYQNQLNIQFSFQGGQGPFTDLGLSQVRLGLIPIDQGEGNEGDSDDEIPWVTFTDFPSSSLSLDSTHIIGQYSISLTYTLINGYISTQIIPLEQVIISNDCDWIQIFDPEYCLEANRDTSQFNNGCSAISYDTPNGPNPCICINSTPSLLIFGHGCRFSLKVLEDTIIPGPPGPIIPFSEDIPIILYSQIPFQIEILNFIPNLDEDNEKYEFQFRKQGIDYNDGENIPLIAQYFSTESEPPVQTLSLPSRINNPGRYELWIIDLHQTRTQNQPVQYIPIRNKFEIQQDECYYCSSNIIIDTCKPYNKFTGQGLSCQCNSGFIGSDCGIEVIMTTVTWHQNQINIEIDFNGNDFETSLVDTDISSPFIFDLIELTTDNIIQTMIIDNIDPENPQKRTLKVDSDSPLPIGEYRLRLKVNLLPWNLSQTIIINTIEVIDNCQWLYQEILQTCLPTGTIDCNPLQYQLPIKTDFICKCNPDSFGPYCQFTFTPEYSYWTTTQDNISIVYSPSETDVTDLNGSLTLSYQLINQSDTSIIIDLTGSGPIPSIPTLVSIPESTPADFGTWNIIATYKNEDNLTSTVTSQVVITVGTDCGSLINFDKCTQHITGCDITQDGLNPRTNMLCTCSGGYIGNKCQWEFKIPIQLIPNNPSNIIWNSITQRIPVQLLVDPIEFDFNSENLNLKFFLQNENSLLQYPLVWEYSDEQSVNISVEDGQSIPIGKYILTVNWTEFDFEHTATTLTTSSQKIEIIDDCTWLKMNNYCDINNTLLCNINQFYTDDRTSPLCICKDGWFGPECKTHIILNESTLYSIQSHISIQVQGDLPIVGLDSINFELYDQSDTSSIIQLESIDFFPIQYPQPDPESPIPIQTAEFILVIPNYTPIPTLGQWTLRAIYLANSIEQTQIISTIEVEDDCTWLFNHQFECFNHIKCNAIAFQIPNFRSLPICECYDSFFDPQCQSSFSLAPDTNDQDSEGNPLPANTNWNRLMKGIKINVYFFSTERVTEYLSLIQFFLRSTSEDQIKYNLNLDTFTIIPDGTDRNYLFTIDIDTTNPITIGYLGQIGIIWGTTGEGDIVNFSEEIITIIQDSAWLIQNNHCFQQNTNSFNLESFYTPSNQPYCLCKPSYYDNNCEQYVQLDEGINKIFAKIQDLKIIFSKQFSLPFDPEFSLLDNDMNKITTFTIGQWDGLTLPIDIIPHDDVIIGTYTLTFTYPYYYDTPTTHSITNTLAEIQVVNDREFMKAIGRECSPIRTESVLATELYESTMDYCTCTSGFYGRNCEFQLEFNTIENENLFNKIENLSQLETSSTINITIEQDYTYLINYSRIYVLNLYSSTTPDIISNPIFITTLKNSQGLTQIDFTQPFPIIPSMPYPSPTPTENTAEEGKYYFFNFATWDSRDDDDNNTDDDEPDTETGLPPIQFPTTPDFVNPNLRDIRYDSPIFTVIQTKINIKSKEYISNQRIVNIQWLPPPRDIIIFKDTIYHSFYLFTINSNQNGGYKDPYTDSIIQLTANIDINQVKYTNLYAVPETILGTISINIPFLPSISNGFEILIVPTSLPSSADPNDPTLQPVVVQINEGLLSPCQSQTESVQCLNGSTCNDYTGQCQMFKRFYGINCGDIIQPIVPKCTLKCPKLMEINENCQQCICKTDFCLKYTRVTMLYLDIININRATKERSISFITNDIQRELTIRLHLNQLPTGQYTNNLFTGQPYPILDTNPTSIIGIETINTLPLVHNSTDTRAVSLFITIQPFQGGNGIIPLAQEEINSRFSTLLSRLHNPEPQSNAIIQTGKVFTSTLSFDGIVNWGFNTSNRPFPIQLKQFVLSTPSLYTVCKNNNKKDIWTPCSISPSSSHWSLCPVPITTTSDRILTPACIDYNGQRWLQNEAPEWCLQKIYPSFPSTSVLVNGCSSTPLPPEPLPTLTKPVLSPGDVVPAGDSVVISWIYTGRSTNTVTIYLIGVEMLTFETTSSSWTNDSMSIFETMSLLPTNTTRIIIFNGNDDNNNNFDDSDLLTKAQQFDLQQTFTLAILLGTYPATDQHATVTIPIYTKQTYNADFKLIVTQNANVSILASSNMPYYYAISEPDRCLGIICNDINAACNRYTGQCTCPSQYEYPLDTFDTTTATCQLKCQDKCQNGSDCRFNDETFKAECSCRGADIFIGDYCEINTTCSNSFCNSHGYIITIDSGEEGEDGNYNNNNNNFSCSNYCQCTGNWISPANTQSDKQCTICSLLPNPELPPTSSTLCDVTGTDLVLTNQTCEKCICLKGFSGDYCNQRSFYATVKFLKETTTPWSPPTPETSSYTIEFDQQSFLQSLQSNFTILQTTSINYPPTAAITFPTLTPAQQQQLVQDMALSLGISTQYVGLSKVTETKIISPINPNPTSAKQSTSTAITFQITSSPSSSSIDDLYNQWSDFQNNYAQSPIAISPLVDNLGATQKPDNAYDPNCVPSGEDTCPAGGDPLEDPEIPVFPPIIPEPEVKGSSTTTIIIAIVVVIVVIAIVAIIALLIKYSYGKKIWCFTEPVGSNKRDKNGTTKSQTGSAGTRGTEMSIATQTSSIDETNEKSGDKNGDNVNSSVGSPRSRGGSRSAQPSNVKIDYDFGTAQQSASRRRASSATSATSGNRDAAIDLEPVDDEESRNLEAGWSKWRHRGTEEIFYTNDVEMKSQRHPPGGKSDMKGRWF